MAVTIKNIVIRDEKQCGLVRTYLSEECIASIIRVRRLGELGTTLAVTSN
jgi:hypothetical protein